MVKTLFLGSNWEAQRMLETLHKDKRFELVGLITQSDKPVGRKQVIEPSEIKKYSLANGIAVFHTESRPELYQEALDKFQPDLIVVKSFGEIIPDFFLEAPKFKAINVHFSLLPKYRGAIPIQMAILKGEKVTGISIMRMVKKFDAGPILAIFEEPILSEDTNLLLRERLVQKSTEVLPDILIDWCDGKVQAIEQDHSVATYCYERELAKEKAEIKWEEMEPEYIERMVRAFIPWPVAWTMFEGKRMKIFSGKLESNTSSLTKPGEAILENELKFATKDPNLIYRVSGLQLEGKSKMSSEEFLRGLKNSASTQ